MGTYNDNVGQRRLEWSYTYTGAELLPHAARLYTQHLAEEKRAREKMASLMTDMNVSQNDPRIQETKRDITTYGALKEQCAVFQHEFARHPNKSYELGLGDITFFELTQAKQ